MKLASLSARKRLGLAGLAILVASLSTLGLIPRRPAFIWNFSDSAPHGFYRVLDRPWRRGDWVAVRPSADLRAEIEAAGLDLRGHLLIKRARAVGGDRVCRSGAVVTLNGAVVALARAQSSTGAALPTWRGCRVLRNGEAFLLGAHRASFDSRYFGAIPSADVLGALAAPTRQNP